MGDKCPAKLDGTVSDVLVSLSEYHESFIHQIEFVGFFTFTDMYIYGEKNNIFIYGACKVIAEEFGLAHIKCFHGFTAMIVKCEFDLLR
jgi:hypothetical protein